MNYFIANLAAHIAVVAVFAALACICATRNRKNKTKHVVSYFRHGERSLAAEELF